MGKINVYDKIVIAIQKKRKYGNYFLRKSPSKTWFRDGIHSLLRRADAIGSADIIYHI